MNQGMNASNIIKGYIHSKTTTSEISLYSSLYMHIYIVYSAVQTAAIACGV